MLGTSEYIFLPIIAAACFFFLLFSLTNTRGVMIVSRLRLVIYSCLMWTLGNIFMQIQLAPGILFWHTVSIAGLYLLPVALYNMVFALLGVKKDGYFACAALGICLMAGINYKFPFIKAPEAVKIETGLYWYRYTPSIGIAVATFIIFGFVFLCTIRVRKVLENAKKEARWVMLLFFAIILIGLAVVLEIIINKGIAFGVIASVPLVIALEYMMAKYYKMQFSEQIRAAIIYVGVLLVAFTPLGANIGTFGNLKYYAFRMDGHDIKMVIIVTATLSILVGIVAQALASLVGVERKNKIKGYMTQFAEDMLGVVGLGEFGDLLRDCLKKVCPNVTPAIYLKQSNTGAMEPLGVEDEEALSEEHRVRIVNNLNDQTVLDEENTRVLKNNGEIIGFITLASKDMISFDAVSEDAISKLCMYTSLYYKNSNVYDAIFRMSIIDPISGLYNKSYWAQYKESHFLPKTHHALLFLNIDDFRLYKALYGDAVTDKVLAWLGRVIMESMRDIGTAFRIGEDEMIIDISENDMDRVKNYVDMILGDIKTKTDGRPDIKENITVSIGVATCPGTAHSCNALLDQAKKACIYAKKAGKATVAFYSDENTVECLNRAYSEIQPFVNVLMSLIDEKDAYTFRHSMNVAKYAEILGRSIKIPEYEIPILREAAMLHDVGKLNTPLEILQKQGTLEPDEQVIMRDHVTEALNIIHYMPNVEFVIPAVASHHERYDGTGYPKGISGEDIPLFGRIIAICDAYDAMASSRPYRRQPLTEEQALQELLDNAETQFDPLLVESMVDLIREGKIFPDIAVRTSETDE